MRRACALRGKEKTMKAFQYPEVKIQIFAPVDILTASTDPIESTVCDVELPIIPV